MDAMQLIKKKEEALFIQVVLCATSPESSTDGRSYHSDNFIVK